MKSFESRHQRYTFLFFVLFYLSSISPPLFQSGGFSPTPRAESIGAMGGKRTTVALRASDAGGLYMWPPSLYVCICKVREREGDSFAGKFIASVSISRVAAALV